MSSSRQLSCALVLAAAHAACSERAPGAGDVDPDASGEEVDVAELDADGGEGGSDVEAGPTGGPLTWIVSTASASNDRICDFDGDGLGDNAIADLGTPLSEMFAAALSSYTQTEIDLNGRRAGFHMPWVEDLATPTDAELTVIAFGAVDTDDPENPEDDFSGEEPLYANANALDACGEPRFFKTDATMEEGALTLGALDMVVPLGDDSFTRTFDVWGHVEPGGAPFELFSCIFAEVARLGAVPTHERFGDITALEVLLAGGAVLGSSLIPGLSPDVDLDGDGLESFEQDEQWHILRCIDGDSTIVEGRDCWADARIADAFSLTFVLSGTTALLAGLEPGWEEEVEGTCDAPPEESLWERH